MGVLRLGTGNAMADAIGAGPATPDGLSTTSAGARRVASRRRLTLLSVEGKPAMFAGFGLDAQILDDFHATVGMLQRAHLANHLRSAGLRYFLAVAGRSVPRFMLVERAEIVAINRGTPAHRVDTDGRPIGAPIPAGRVLWRGKASLASAATIPYFGLGMKMFPARRSRAGALPAATVRRWHRGDPRSPAGDLEGRLRQPAHPRLPRGPRGARAVAARAAAVQR